jgi:hypothetical protein
MAQVRVTSKALPHPPAILAFVCGAWICAVSRVPRGMGRELDALGEPIVMDGPTALISGSLLAAVVLALLVLRIT